MPASSSAISAWSNSRLDVFETCAYRAYLQYVEKIPTPELVPPEGKDEHPLLRGVRIHTAAEKFVTEDILLIDDLKNFERPLLEAREQFRTAPETCVVEQDWAITDTWTPTNWYSEDVWGRMKLDLGLINGTHMRVIDYKTGKKYPLKHRIQGQLYGLCASLRYPDIETFSIEFWYTDMETDNVLVMEYSKIRLRVFQDYFERRAHALTSAVEFLPRPSSYACRFCPYGAGKDGNKHCEFHFEDHVKSI